MKERLVTQNDGSISHEGYSERAMERLVYDPELDFSRGNMDFTKTLEQLDLDSQQAKAELQRNFVKGVKIMLEKYGVNTIIPIEWFDEYFNCFDGERSAVNYAVRKRLKSMGYVLEYEDNYLILEDEL